MTTYYVRTSGTDTADGLTPATAWRTIGKALGATGISSGDTVYIGSGVYRECITVNMTSATAETFVIGDVLGSHTGDDPGEIRVTNYLTNDTTAPTETTLLALNTRDHLTFQKILFHALYSTQITGISSPAICQYIKFISCSFAFMSRYASGDTPLFYVYGAADTPLHWEIDSCVFLNNGTTFTLLIDYLLAHTVDFDVDFVVENCLIIGSGYGVRFAGYDGVSIKRAGGLIIRNNFFNVYLSDCILVGGAAAAFPVLIYNNIIIPGPYYYGINCNAAADVVQNYNYILAMDGLARNNAPAGANTIENGSKAFLIHWGQESLAGQTWRPFGMPTADSPLLGFGNHASAPSVDILGRPRPAGGESTLNAVGPYERHDTAQDETTIYDSAPASQKIVGPGDQDYELPVLAEETVITIKVLYDDAHGTTNKPQVQLLANDAIGVTGETLTSDGEPNGWATLEFAAFTPTDRGVVVLRCMSRSASAAGVAYFDTITVNGA